MASFVPRFKLVYYKHLLENSFSRFIGEHGDDFTRDCGTYVFSSPMSLKRIRDELERNILEEIDRYSGEYSVVKPEYLVVIGSCFPKSNILLKYIPENIYIPEKLRKYMEEHPDVKYFHREKDLRFDDDALNCIFEEMFNDFFRNPPKRNVVFVKHRNLDCYLMFKVLKNIYGSANIVNVHDEYSGEMRNSLVSINEWILKYARKRNIINNEEMRLTVAEIRQHLRERLGL
jgi:hypothetical protein